MASSCRAAPPAPGGHRNLPTVPSWALCLKCSQVLAGREVMPPHPAGFPSAWGMQSLSSSVPQQACGQGVSTVTPQSPLDSPCQASIRVTAQPEPGGRGRGPWVHQGKRGVCAHPSLASLLVLGFMQRPRNAWGVNLILEKPSYKCYKTFPTKCQSLLPVSEERIISY